MIVGIASQPFRLDFELDGTPSSRVPDDFVSVSDGSCRVIDVRPDDHINEHDRDVFAATAKISQPVGWGYQRVGALPRILAANSHWLGD